MPKFVRFTRILAITLVLALASGTLPGCSQPQERTTVMSFLSYLEHGEYPRVYGLLSQKAKESISLVELSKRYQDIYSAIGIKMSSCTLKKLTPVGQDHMTADFTMSAASDTLGAFELSMQAAMVEEGSQWRIDWTPELILPGLQDGYTAKLITTAPERGGIFDADGKPLATEGHAVSVYVDTSQVTNWNALPVQLAPILGLTESEVSKRLKSAMAAVSPASSASPSASPTPSPSPTPDKDAAQQDTARSYVLKTYPKDGLTDKQRAALLAIPGVGIDDSWMTEVRSYPYGNTMAQALGYTGVISEAELAMPQNAGLSKSAVIGKTGLEAAFETQLRGKPGYDLVITDDSGGTVVTLAHKPAVNGSDLRLSVDMGLQQRAEMLLRQYLTPDMAGCIIVMNPKTGFIQALASAPSFDPNMFSYPVDPALWKQLNDPTAKNPFLCRPTQGTYPPGSTFKPFTAFMGLTDKVISTSSVFPFEIKSNLWTPAASWGFTDPIKRMDPTPGALNLQNAITYSDNIYFAWAALKVGSNSFYKHCVDLGVNTPIPFDLPVKTGKISNSDRIDTQRQLADSGYGQGELLVAPVQMAALFGSLDNSGDVMVPRIVSSICHTDGPRYVVDKATAPEVWKQAVVPKSILNILIPDLKLVVQKGTASALNTSSLKQYEICAKTGTAEIGNDKSREIAWLIGFATKNMDRLVCVCLEVPAKGGSIRLDIAKGMFEAKASTDEAKATKAP